MTLERSSLGPLPVLGAGEGPPLLYVGGLLPVAGVDSSLARRTAEFSVRPFSDIRTVVYANRRTALPRGMTIGAIAAEHAEAIGALGGAPIDVIGVSTGGSIAQQLAAEHPETVRRLVLLGTGSRLSAKTRRIQARVAQQVRAGDDKRALASTVGAFLPAGDMLERLIAPLMSRFARRLGDLSDLATTIEAEDGFDLARCQGTIAAPTLIVAGARDRFYPRPLLEETRRLIPGSVLQVIPRRGHLTVMSDSRVVAMVRAHLTGLAR
jgi:pimeloyl-ACP methyl ester carboxylesterase